MSEVKWIKLTTDIFDDEKIKVIDALPERDGIFVIWIRMLVLAGKKNEGGTVYLQEEIPYTDEMLSTIFNRPVSIIRLALETFQRMNMIRILDNQRIEIVNWDKHQNVEGLERLKEQNRLRVAAFRKKQKDKDKNKTRLERNITVTLPEYSKFFEQFWEIYPRKVNKKGAYKKWITTKKREENMDTVLQGAEVYAAECKRKKTDMQYIKHPATFLGPDEHWREYAEKYKPPKEYVEPIDYKDYLEAREKKQ